MHDVWTTLLLATMEWLQTPSTWVAVLAPGAFSIAYLWRFGASRKEALAALSFAALGFASADLKTVDGALELYIPPLYPCAVMLLAGFRWYLPPVGRAFSLCWLIMVLADVSCMAWMGAGNPDVQLPMGIGGAGFGDALFAHPLLLAIGLAGLAWERRRIAGKHQNGKATALGRGI